MTMLEKPHSGRWVALRGTKRPGPAANVDQYVGLELSILRGTGMVLRRRPSQQAMGRSHEMDWPIRS